jgi:hypothetical protein
VLYLLLEGEQIPVELLRFTAVKSGHLRIIAHLPSNHSPFKKKAPRPDGRGASPEHSRKGRSARPSRAVCYFLLSLTMTL